MVDSGATSNFVDAGLARRLGLRLQPVNKTVRLANGVTAAAEGTLTAACELQSKQGTYKFQESFLATPMSGHQAILGRPWLSAHNPAIDWRVGKTAVVCTTDVGGVAGRGQHALTLAAVAAEDRAAARGNGAVTTAPAGPTTRPTTPTAAAMSSMRAVGKHPPLPRPAEAAPYVRAAICASTDDGREQGRCDASRERVLATYKDVTPEALPPVLPPSRGTEHRIELLDGAVPRSFALRRRNVRETEELRRQISEMLKLGFIRPSHSPYGARR